MAELKESAGKDAAALFRSPTISKKDILPNYCFSGAGDATAQSARRDALPAPMLIPVTEGRKLAVIMVGLPARGKSFMARKIARYLAWRGKETAIFNVGNYRRKLYGAQMDHTFFDASNEEGVKARRHCAEQALKDMFEWFETKQTSSTLLAIYDATNSTIKRRTWLRNECLKNGVEPLFVESFCDDDAVIEANVRATKLSSPDYAHSDPEDAVKDFLNRIRQYADVYQTLGSDEEGKDHAYIKTINAGTTVIAHNIQGYTHTRILYYLLNLRLRLKPIYLSRHGQSVYNQEGKIGGDSDITEKGHEYGKALAKFVHDNIESEYPNYKLWTSTLRRTIHTASYIGRELLQWRALDEIEAGEANGLTYKEIEERMPEEFAERQRNKLAYRYPRGESYQDLIVRVEPIVEELERSAEPVVIVSHQAVLRVLFAYFTEKSHVETPNLPIPLHTLIKLTPSAYGCDVEWFPLCEANVPDANSSS